LIFIPLDSLGPHRSGYILRVVCRFPGVTQKCTRSRGSLEVCSEPAPVAPVLRSASGPWDPNIAPAALSVDRHSESLLSTIPGAASDDPARAWSSTVLSAVG